MELIEKAVLTFGLVSRDNVALEVVITKTGLSCSLLTDVSRIPCSVEKLAMLRRQITFVLEHPLAISGCAFA